MIEESTLISDLKNMFWAKEFCDVVFIIENEEIPAHKAVLSSRCEQFKCMFSGKNRFLLRNPLKISYFNRSNAGITNK